METVRFEMRGVQTAPSSPPLFSQMGDGGPGGHSVPPPPPPEEGDPGQHLWASLDATQTEAYQTSML